MNKKEAILVVNTRSRKGDKLVFQAIEELNSQGIQLVSIHAVFNKKTLRTAISKIKENTCKLIIIGSGDGTISTIVDELAFTDKIIGILPFGTTNNFARTLELPATIKECVEIIAVGKIIPIDLGKVNDIFFANVTSIGLSAVLADDVPHTLKRYVGRLAYTLTGLFTFFKHRAFTCHIRSADFEETIKTHQLIVANGRFHAGIKIQDDAKIDNKKFIIFTLGGISRFEYIKTSIAYLFGKHKNTKGTFYAQTDDFTVTLDRKNLMEIDGEPSKITQAHFQIAPNSLQVIVPETYTGTI